MSALRRVVFAAVAIAPIAAHAADIPLIRIFPPACETAPVSVDAFVDALRVELAGRQPHCCVVGPGDDAAADAVKVTLSIEPCDASTEEIGVLVDVAQPPRALQRQVSLADLPPEARPRALALAVAELIRSATGSLQPEAPPPPPEPPPAAAPPRHIGLAGSVAGDVRRHFAHATTLWGARLGLSLAYGRWHATVDAGAAANRTDVDAGNISILLASAALFAGPRFTAGPVIVSFGPTGALGWAWIKGQSDTAARAGEGSGLVGTAGIRAAVAGPTAHVIRLFGHVEGGLTIRRLDADVFGQPAAGISGPYLMVAAGVAFGPS